MGFDLELQREKSGLRGNTSGRIPTSFGVSWRESPARLCQNPGIKSFSKSNIPPGASNTLPPSPSLRGHRVRGWIQGIPGNLWGHPWGWRGSGTSPGPESQRSRESGLGEPARRGISRDLWDAAPHKQRRGLNVQGKHGDAPINYPKQLINEGIWALRQCRAV